MLFVKYISDVVKDHRDRYAAEYKGDPVRIARRLAQERFQLPDTADFDSLYAQRNEADLGQRINIALEHIEEANKAKLEGVFREVDFNSEGKLGQTKERNSRIKGLLEVFADPRLDLRPSVVGSNDVIGNVYEYLLEKFASEAGKKAGEFYTGFPSPLSALPTPIAPPTTTPSPPPMRLARPRLSAPSSPSASSNPSTAATSLIGSPRPHCGGQGSHTTVRAVFRIRRLETGVD